MQTGFHFPSIGTYVENRATLLAIDDFLLPQKKNLCYYLSKPAVRLEPVLVPSHEDPIAPDALAAHFYGTVLHDQGRFRMWYYAVGLGDAPGQLGHCQFCYAESADGITWTKPDLGQVEFKGSRHNNALAVTRERTAGINVIKDEADPDPQRRYKLACEYVPPDAVWPTNVPSIRTAISPDGLHWTFREQPHFDCFIEEASLYKHNGLYIVNGQIQWPFVMSEGGQQRGRQGYAVVSPDFDHWLQEPVESFVLPEPEDPPARAHDQPSDQVHLGVGAASFGTVVVGLYGLWHNKPTTDDWFGVERTSCDFGLVVSHDGLYFREPVKGYVYLAREDTPVTQPPGKNYPNILCQANGILNVGDETRIYHGRWRNAAYGDNYYAEVALATLPRDRWGALGLNPGAAEGAVWSVPVLLPAGGCTLALNADGAQHMRVEVADEHFTLFPQFSGENAGTCEAERGLEAGVTWSQGSLAALAGTKVRFRVRLQRQGATEPRLYAMYLAVEEMTG